MTWVAAVGALSAVALACLALSLRTDPVVTGRIRSRPQPPRPAVPVAPVERGPESSTADLVDLVAVTVGAGLSPAAALDRASRAFDGTLGKWLSEARRAVSLGASWRSALRGVARRSGDRDLGRLALILDRGERLGAPVADALRSLARQVREERRVAAEERARRAPVVMLFPLVLCILPAFLLSALVPALLVATRGVG